VFLSNRTDPSQKVLNFPQFSKLISFKLALLKQTQTLKTESELEPFSPNFELEFEFNAGILLPTSYLSFIYILSHGGDISSKSLYHIM